MYVCVSVLARPSALHFFVQRVCMSAVECLAGDKTTGVGCRCQCVGN